ncbi:unnamed protein product, partial [Peniophora sp. CBMAI 1063]
SIHRLPSCLSWLTSLALVFVNPNNLTHNDTIGRSTVADTHSQDEPRSLSGAREAPTDAASSSLDDPREGSPRSETPAPGVSQEGHNPSSQATQAADTGPHPLPPLPQAAGGPPVHPQPANPRPPRGARRTRASLQIVTQNIRGRRSASDRVDKLADFHLRIKEHGFAVSMIQEAHTSVEDAATLEQNFQRIKAFASPIPNHKSSHGGILFLVNTEKVSPKDLQHTVIIPGRAALLTIKWQAGNTLTLLNVYAPATSDQERKDFFKDIAHFYDLHPGTRHPDFMGGDFNMVDEGLDKSGNDDSSASVVEALLALRTRFNLQDSFQAINPDKRVHSWRRADGTWSCIDQIYIAAYLIPYMLDANIENIGVDSDHLTVSTTVESKDAPYIGKGNWVFLKNLLKSKTLNEKLDVLFVETGQTLAQMEERSEEANPQLLLHAFKQKVQKITREHDKVAQPTKLATPLKSAREQRDRTLRREGPQVDTITGHLCNKNPFIIYPGRACGLNFRHRTDFGRIWVN